MRGQSETNLGQLYRRGFANENSILSIESRQFPAVAKPKSSGLGVWLYTGLTAKQVPWLKARSFQTSEPRRVATECNRSDLVFIAAVEWHHGFFDVEAAVARQFNDDCALIIQTGEYHRLP